MKPLVIYHDSCADGFAAAFAAWLKLGDDAEYVPMQYGDRAANFDMDVSHRDVYIVDFSFPKLTMDRFFATAKRVVWLDHHKTAFEMWCGEYEKGMCVDQSNGRDEVLLDDNKSGAILAWEYFHPGTEIPMLFRHVDDYDRWQFKLEGTKAFQQAIWSHAPWTFTQWDDWLYDVEEESDHGYWPDLYAEGAAILRAHDQNVAAIVRGATRKCVIEVPSFKGQNCQDTNYPYHVASGLAANCPPHLQSDVGHELAVQSGTFGLLWSIDKNMTCKCSLRSNGDYDVAAIAKSFGGGGHRNAAGFTVPIETLLGWLS